MPAGVVVHPLEGHELVHRCDSRGVVRRNPQLGAPREIAHRVGDDGALRRHHVRARHLARVDEGGGVEVSRTERIGDRAQVPANLRDARRVVLGALELNTAAVGEGVEQMDRRVLVHAHRPRVGATTLDSGERTVRVGALGGPIVRVP